MSRVDGYRRNYSERDLDIATFVHVDDDLSPTGQIRVRLIAKEDEEHKTSFIYITLSLKQLSDLCASARAGVEKYAELVLSQANEKIPPRTGMLR